MTSIFSLMRNVLGFFRRDNQTAVVEPAVRAGTMLEFLFVAVRAFLQRRGGCFVMCAPLAAACFGMASFWIWHGFLVLSNSVGGTGIPACP